MVIVVVAVMSKAVRNADLTGLLPWEVAWATFRWYRGAKTLASCKCGI